MFKDSMTATDLQARRMYGFNCKQIAIISLHSQHPIASAVDKQLLIVTPQVPASAL
jgi:hypothetical protein